MPKGTEAKEEQTVKIPGWQTSCEISECYCVRLATATDILFKM